MAKVNPIQVQKFLKGMNYPASKKDVLQRAGDNGADQNTRSSLEQLPDEKYDSPADLSKAIGKIE